MLLFNILCTEYKYLKTSIRKNFGHFESCLELQIESCLELQIGKIDSNGIFENLHCNYHMRLRNTLTGLNTSFMILKV